MDSIVCSSIGASPCLPENTVTPLRWGLGNGKPNHKVSHTTQHTHLHTHTHTHTSKTAMQEWRNGAGTVKERVGQVAGWFGWCKRWFEIW